jgi:hypothetical protein
VQKDMCDIHSPGSGHMTINPLYKSIQELFTFSLLLDCGLLSYEDM